jgi:GPH family glycoside/pentoside/hexuronide:cation symporter
MEYDRHRSGIERAGIFAGIFVMVEKITSAVGAAVFGGVLGAVGYVAAKDSSAAVQPAGVLDGIIFILAVLPSIASLLACLVLRLYDLDETRVTTGMASGATSPA